MTVPPLLGNTYPIRHECGHHRCWQLSYCVMRPPRPHGPHNPDRGTRCRYCAIGDMRPRIRQEGADFSTCDHCGSSRWVAA